MIDDGTGVGAGGELAAIPSISYMVDVRVVFMVVTVWLIVTWFTSNVLKSSPPAAIGKTIPLIEQPFVKEAAWAIATLAQIPRLPV